MKRLPALLFLLAILASVLLAQLRTDSTVFFKIDALVEREDFSELPKILGRDTAAAPAYWAYFCDQVKIRAEWYYDQDTMFVPAIQLLDQALQTLGRAGRADSLGTARLWVWKARSHRDLEQYSDALEAYNRALRIYEIHRFNAPIVAYAYNNAAQVHIRRQNYAQANQYLEAALQSDSTGYDLLSIYSQLANNAYWQDSLDLAWRYFQLGQAVPGEGSSRAALQSVGADLLLRRGRYPEAASLIRLSLNYYYDQPEEGENRIRCYATLSTLAARQGKWAEAEAFFKKAEAEGRIYFKNGKSRELAKLYTEWGDMLADAGRAPAALEAYQRGLVQAFPNFNDLDPAVNPGLEEVPLELWAMQAPASKAALLLQQPTADNRRAAAHCFDLAFAAAERLRRTYGADDAKIFQARRNYNLRREAALNLWEWYRQSGDARLLERLFLLLENNRANALRDALGQQRALALSSVPDSLLQREEQLRLDLASLKADIQNRRSTGTATALLERESTRLQILYDALLRQLKSEFGQFRDYLEAGQTAGLADIRAALHDSAVLLSWFDAGDRYLCLALRRNGLFGFETPRDSALEQAVLNFQTALSDKAAQERDPAVFFAAAWFLKQRLLPDSILRGTNALAIAPDGALAYLPVEVLLTQPHRGPYSTAPYLLRSHRVQYLWSAALLAAPKGARESRSEWLQVAPFVPAGRRGLAPLPNSLRELPEDGPSEVWQGEQAVAGAFLEQAANYGLLHLSTHAHAGGGAEPGIEMYDRAVGLSEIYGQRLQAQLVALSACETGTGAFAGGEGVLSLARAFAYAGAQSLVASYWSVPDRSTADLFTEFYRQLGAGQTRSEALRQAKLALLRQAGPDARKAPFYWAAFTLSGADGPVELPVGRAYFWWVLALGLAAGLLGWWWWWWRQTFQAEKLG